MKLSCVFRTSSGVTLGILFSIGGASIASAHNHKPSAGSFATSGKTVQNPCSNPIVLSTGGACCPLSPLSQEKCSQKKAQPVNRAVSDMKPLKVNGVTIPLPVVTQMVKKGLRRSWSSAKEDLDLMVCGYGRTNIRNSAISNSRIPALNCLSNKAHFGYSPSNPYSKHPNFDPRKTNVRCYADCFLTEGNVVASIVRYIDYSSHRAQLISSLISRTPTTKAAYSLRVPETVPMQFPSLHNKIVNVPVFVTFTVKNGDLADIKLAKRSGKTGAATN